MTEEYKELLPVFGKAAYGSYLIIPLKYETKVRQDWLKEIAEPSPVTTMDLMEQTRAVYDEKNPVHAGVRYRITADTLMTKLFGSADRPLYAVKLNAGKPDPDQDRIIFTDSDLYVFTAPVAFLALGIRYSSMDVLARICHPGYSSPMARYFLGENEVSLEGALQEMLEGIGMLPFFQAKETIFLEAYAFNVAVVEKRFREIETMRQAAFNLHHFQDLTEPLEDSSEEDVHYVYAVLDSSLASYRWACCVTSQTISYVFGGSDETIEEEMELSAADGIPLVMLALQQKYTCLRFTELLSRVERHRRKKLRELRKMMLAFRAYATVDPANISRWHNIRRIYEWLYEDLGVKSAVEDIGNKLGMLADYQQDIDTSQYNTITWLITLFGIVSILASVLTIIQFLNAGSRIYWIVTLLLTTCIIIAAAAAIVINKRSS